MQNFIHNIPTRVYFGKGQVKALRKELRARATKILLVTGHGSVKKNGIFDDVLGEVKDAKVSYCELDGVDPNPRLKSVHKGIDIVRKEGVDLILAVGGGSVIDASKAIACGAEYDGDVWDFFTRESVPDKALPVGCVLTLAAAGSEMNANSVISNAKKQRKLAMGAAVLRPAFSILDPEYTYTVNSYHTAAGIADIMTHIFEQYFSHTPATDVQDAIAEGLLKVCLKYGPVVCDSPRDYDARANIMWAGSLALNGLVGEGKVNDWASHAIEHELSAVYDISHGAGLAVVVPRWMNTVLGKDTAAKFTRYGVNVWGLESKEEPIDIAKQAISRTQEFFTRIGMPGRLRDMGISAEHFKDMAKSALRDWGEVGHFKSLSEVDIIDILDSAL